MQSHNMQMNMYRHKVKNVSQLSSSLLTLYLAYTGALFGDQVVNIQKSYASVNILFARASSSS